VSAQRSVIRQSFHKMGTLLQGGNIMPCPTKCLCLCLCASLQAERCYRLCESEASAKSSHHHHHHHLIHCLLYQLPSEDGPLWETAATPSNPKKNTSVSPTRQAATHLGLQVWMVLGCPIMDSWPLQRRI